MSKDFLTLFLLFIVILLMYFYIFPNEDEYIVLQVLKLILFFISLFLYIGIFVPMSVKDKIIFFVITGILSIVFTEYLGYALDLNDNMETIPKQLIQYTGSIGLLLLVLMKKFMDS
jgi:predicted membrane protein